jgi:hypothetical protein
MDNLKIVGESVIFDDKTIVRRLVENDHEEVLRISKGLYNGFDTFSVTFPLYAKDREFHYMYGMFIDGKLVASLCRTFTQDNICWGESLRVDESLRGHKLMSTLNIGARLLIREIPKFAKITHFRLTYAGLYGMERLVASNFPQCLAYWGSIVIPEDALSTILERIPKSNVTPLNLVGPTEFLKLQKVLPTRFKEYILSNWRYYDATRECVEMLSKGERAQEKCEFWKDEGGSLSLSSNTLTHSGLRYTMTIETNEMSSLFNHLRFHADRGLYKIGGYKAYMFHTEYLLAKEFEKYCTGTSAFFLPTTGYEQIKWLKPKL